MKNSLFPLRQVEGQDPPADGAPAAGQGRAGGGAQDARGEPQRAEERGERPFRHDMGSIKHFFWQSILYLKHI